LKSRFEAGLTCREIAADIGVTRNAVIGKLARLNLSREDERGARFARANARSENSASAAREPASAPESFARAACRRTHADQRSTHVRCLS